MTIDFTDLQGVVNDFAESVPLTINRPGAATVVNGRRISGALTPVVGVVGSAWPVTGKTITLLEKQGIRITAGIDVFTPFDALNIADDRTATPGDLITHNGNVYEFIACHDWVRGPFYHYTARLVNT